MKLQTASETISFIKELEEKAATFYEELAKRYPEKAGDFLSFAKENRKYIKQVQMAYQSVITDAIEGCYAFNLESDEFSFDTNLPENATLAEAAQKALQIEGKIINCYSIGVEQSGALLADVPRNFKIVVKKRNNRLDRLKSFAGR
ncbi:MAG: hypothetical protein JRH08_01660 [Deltaproteobacteria bacterium]|nr:hypothetical protein [Deltaproteobacteria bacterium]MBW1929527.1 hypothetical protein [Deltaproteobacteria bacterium]MBW2024057.1 hypothetical protein [Deltaproteobacteria bacterium]MBW2124408.1 hypothetical protein [Deltaproteobacteria bacterium]